METLTTMKPIAWIQWKGQNYAVPCEIFDNINRSWLQDRNSRKVGLDGAEDNLLYLREQQAITFSRDDTV